MDQHGPTSTPEAPEPERPAPFLPEAKLPKGGGAVRGIGEKVTVNPARGTCSVQLPVYTSPGRGGFGPSLALGYDSGGGNSPFGMGWGLPVAAIARKTDRGLPHYTDSDTFMLSGSEELVPSEETAPDETIDSITYRVRRFRPRVQNAFTRIECLTGTGGVTFWRTISAENVRSIFGRTARIADPADPSRVFQWLLESVSDDRGNVVEYEYEAETPPAGTEVWDRHRRGQPQAQRHLRRVRYCGHFLVELEYEPRPDPFSSYRAGFEVRTSQRCHRIAMYHDFAAEFAGDGGPNPRLVRTTDLSYEDDSAGAHLVAVGQTGYLWRDGGYLTESLPPVQLEYTKTQPDDVVRTVDAQHLPSGVDGKRCHWLDLDGEGLAGALTEQHGAWFYRRNLGGGRLGALETVALQPSLAGDGGSVALIDVAGDGGRSLVRHGPALHGFQERSGEGWAPFTPFAQRANIAWDDPALRQLDIDGDGIGDVLFLHGEELRYHLSQGREGYGPQLRTLLGSDEESGPVLLSAAAGESVVLADMSGDGLGDLVRVRNGSVVYWPNLGHGRFGAKVTMGGAPVFDNAEMFEPTRLRVVDIDGSGPADLLYLGREGISIWRNQSGNHFGAPVTLPAFPQTDDLSTVDVADVLGTGTSCLVWSSSNVADRDAPLRYLDLSRAVSGWLPAADSAGHKAHLLCQVTNNLGGQTRFVYAPSTRFYVADREAGTPWLTRLHFPVQVVARTEVYDHVAKTRMQRSYRYRHGYFDASEREFRGFAMVEQTDRESVPLFDEVGATELHRPPARVRSWFHTGAAADWSADFHAIDVPLGASELPQGLSARQRREALRALAGLPLRTEVYADDGSAQETVPYSVSEHRYRVEVVADRVFRHHPLETLTHHYERDAADPRVKHDIVLEVDEFNVVRSAVSIGYPRRIPQLPEQEQLAVVRTVSEVVHVTSGPEYRLGVPVRSRSYEVTGLAPAGQRFTLAEAAAPGVERLTEHVRTRYWNDALTDGLPLGQVGLRSLVHSTDKIAFAPAEIDLFEGRVDAALLAEGGYLFEEGAWWIPSGVRHYDPAAHYLPVGLESPFGNTSSVTYDPYDLFAVTVSASATAPFDALTTQALIDYRVLGPAEIIDANGSRAAAAFDALGRVTALWTRGNDGSGDPHELPGTEFAYHTGSWPTWTQSRKRELHGDAQSPWQWARVYSDGSGRIVMTKQQAEPGPDGEPRWVGSGRTVFDNKGLPVKQYEPYFSATDAYEDEPDIVQQGVTTVRHYDPAGRLARVDHPDGTFSRVVVGPWQTERWDASDTVLDSLWYAERGAPDPQGEPEPADPARRAAWLSARHANTPALSRMDSLGRPARAVADGGPLGQLETVTERDIEGSVLSVTDPRGIAVFAARYDLAGRAVFTHSPDAGERWTLHDIAGVPIRVWDSRGHVHEHRFDPLRRPVRNWVTLPSSQRILTSATWYGEAHPAALPRNLMGRKAVALDGSGLTHTVEYDFKGNVLVSRHRLATQYQQTPDWSAIDAAAVSDVEAEAAALGLLESELQQSTTQFDALNRAVHNVLPDGTVIAMSYNEGGMLESLKADDELYVRELDYDAKGQRQLIVYGNFVRTRYTYDPLTYRLTRVETFRSGAPGAHLQDLNYLYDAVGNVVEIRDNAQQTHFYAGQVLTPSTRYEYDALHRLSFAAGREHESLGAQPDHAEPSFGKPIPHPNDAAKVRGYRQTYSYDSSGNIAQIAHVAVGSAAASWTRDYTYALDSNRLVSHTRPQGPAGFPHDPHGNMTALPHLPGNLTWDHADRLTAVQLLGGGTGFYAYDGGGERSRKVLHRNGGLVEEHIYLGDFEIHRRVLNGTETFRRTTVHLTDDAQRIALIERDTGSGERRVRYQLGNHLGSCSLEVDNSPAALVVSYEEYHPYGTTSLWLGAGDVEASARRYRYTGKERDEETGLYYHGARYYSPWLARWTAADPSGLADGTCVYAYCRGNPIMLRDPSGGQSAPPVGMLDPKIGGIWEQAVVEELGGKYGTKTYSDTVREFQKDVAKKIASKGMGSNTKEGTGIHFARKTYASVRTRFGKLAAEKGISLDGIQLHHGSVSPNDELAKNPAKALDTTNLTARRGHAGTKGSEHNLSHDVNKKIEEGGSKNPGQDVKEDWKNKGIKPDVREWGPTSRPNPDGPPDLKADAPPDVDDPKGPKGPKKKPKVDVDLPKIKGGGTLGKIANVGIALGVLAYTGDAWAAVQTANPLAETTDSLLSEEDTWGDTGKAAIVDGIDLTPAGLVIGLFGVIVPEGESASAPHCPGLCHSTGGTLDPNYQWNKDSPNFDFDKYQELTDEEMQQLLQYLNQDQ